MTTHAKHHIPWYLWPFAAIWKLLAVIVELTGRLVAMILGIVLIIVGVLVSLTITGIYRIAVIPKRNLLAFTPAQHRNTNPAKN